ncbi:MAG: hypothetical protein ABI305_09605, partial [Tepidiformaceae bacterium]
MTQTASNWRERYASKLGSAAEAVRIVKPGDKVWAGGWTSVPTELFGTLAARAGELHDVTVGTYLTPFNWDTPKILDSFKIIT